MNRCKTCRKEINPEHRDDSICSHCRDLNLERTLRKLRAISAWVTPVSAVVTAPGTLSGYTPIADGKGMTK